MQGNISYSIQTTPAASIHEVLDILCGYVEADKLNLFDKPASLPQFPTRRFIPESEGLYHRITEKENQNGWESEVLSKI